MASLGISPHPGVVLVVEGETEEFIAPLVRDHIRVPRDADLLQSEVLRGVGHDLTKLAAYAIAPLIEPAGEGSWLLVKPPTQLAVVVDPDKPFDTRENVKAQRTLIIAEIVSVVRARGVDPALDEIDSLVTVTTWPASCFEFEHFSDDELAKALLVVHRDCSGLGYPRLCQALAQQRAHRCDIKNLWTNWRPEVRKTDLAKKLWPALRQKLDAAASGTAPEPSIASVLIEAYRRSAARHRGRYLMHGSPTC